MMIPKSFSKTILMMAFTLVIMTVSQAHAQIPSRSVPKFTPMGAWKIESTNVGEVRGLDKLKLPCMMTTSFDNGYVMRLSGGNNAFLAMAIDFRQNVFTKGRKYSSVMSTDNNFRQEIQATAFSESVLIFNLRPYLGFYPAIIQAQSLALSVEGNVFAFALGNTAGAVQNLESCFGTPIVPMAPQMATSAMAAPTMPMAQPNPPSKVMTWNAVAGDDMQTILMRWGERAGVNVAWEATGNGQVVSDFSMEGTFEQAVQNLMAQNATAMGIEANMMGGNMPNSGMMNSGAPQSLRPSASTLPPPQPSAILAPSMPATKAQWSASAGNDLQGVLRAWSKAANVDFIWQSNYKFTLKRNVNNNAGYEAALQEVLNQFSADGLRPAAQLNNDPSNGQKTLLVDATRL